MKSPASPRFALSILSVHLHLRASLSPRTSAAWTYFRQSLLIGICALVAALSACGSRGSGKQEDALYVTATQASLRDRVAPVYTKTGTVRNGDRVVVLERGKRWERVRNAAGEEGWLQDRYLVGENVFVTFQQMYRDHQNDPAQAHGVVRADFRLHVTPGRDTDRLFLLKEGDKVALLQRTTVAKAASSAPPPPQLQSGAEEKQDATDAAKEDAAKEEEKEYKAGEKPSAPSPSAKKPVSQERLTGKEKARHDKMLAAAPAVPMEDWWLVRSAQGHSGWILARMIDVEVPLEIAQYAEGQRIVAFYPLNAIHDSELNKDVPYYLVLMTEPKDGMPFDYNQIRVFSWNNRKHRYETAYRQRNVFGFLPVSVGKESFENLGEQPTFTIHVRDGSGSTAEQKYRLEGVIVKRVLAAGAVPVKTAQVSGSKSKRSAR